MENLIKTISFYSEKDDMWVWIGIKEDGGEVYNWMQGNDYAHFSRNYSKPDKALTYFINEIKLFSGGVHSGDLDNKSIIELIWIFTHLKYVHLKNK